LNIMNNFFRLSIVATAVAIAAMLGLAPSVEALPSFGTKIPNGDKVPCPSEDLGNTDSGCTDSGLCLGLGHPNCGGFQVEDKDENNQFVLSPFGEDWRANGFVWTRELCELDSDGDGFTNGQELGDPCCEWSAGYAVAMNSVEGFAPSHPGRADETQQNGVSVDALCASVDSEDNVSVNEDDILDEYYNPQEERRSFDLVMKPYPIPIRTTTYTDFVFNLPEDVPDLFHVVFGEVINSQPDHLHHFVLTGCSRKYDVSEEGVPLASESLENDCLIQLGGWAPGTSMFGSIDIETGVLMGRGLGIEAVRLNVHYTDGVYADASTKTQRMATDGIRVHYTPDFRPYTGLQKELINIGFGPDELVIPPGESRFFISRTCKVNTSCKDSTQDKLYFASGLLGLDIGLDDLPIDGELSCASIQPFCNVGGELGPYVQRICPASCGLCEESNGDKVNPFNPESYRVTSIHYHAHLLGSEMYTTLIREEIETNLDANNTTIAIQKPIPSSTTMAKDLKSREIWYFDDQVTIPFDFDIATDNAPMRGTEIKAGDKIQVSCVYDSTDRADATFFGLSTYDEMCITATRVTFETPASLLASNSNNDTLASGQRIDLLTELLLMTFSCDDDDETTDVYTGVLAQDEDARNIWKDHPIEDAEGCTFPVMDFLFFSNELTDEERNCPASEGGANDSYICDGLSNVEFLSDGIAGATCDGGTFDQQDLNEGVTERNCVEGGGLYYLYYCDDVEFYLIYEAEAIGLTSEIVEYLLGWYQPRCCSIIPETEMKGDIAEIVSAAPVGFAGGDMALFSAAAATILAMAIMAW